MKLWKSRTLSVLMSLLFSLPTLASPIVMAYWTDWSPYWETRPYPISGSLNSQGKILSNPDFDAAVQNLNVLVYAFLETDPNGVIQFFDTWSDLSAKDASFCQNHLVICRDQTPNSGLGNFSAFSQLKNVKRIISIGGYGHDASMEQAMANPKNFVDSLSAIIREYRIDGVDLDFEPPVWNASLANQYLSLIQAIRQALPDTWISIAFTANPSEIDAFDGNTHQWKTISELVNAIGVMAYDFHGGFDGIGQPTGFQSNLYTDPNEPTAIHYSADAAVKTFLARDVPAKKLVLGAPAYGRIVTSVADNAKHGLYQPIGGIFSSGDLGGEMESYYSIMGKYLGQGYQDYWLSIDNHLSGVFVYEASTGNFVSFDNTALIDSKVSYVKQNQLAGMMMWELRADIPPNDPNNVSLVKHMYQGLLK